MISIICNEIKREFVLIHDKSKRLNFCMKKYKLFHLSILRGREFLCNNMIRDNIKKSAFMLQPTWLRQCKMISFFNAYLHLYIACGRTMS